MPIPNERVLTDFVLKDNTNLNKYSLELDGAYRWIDLTCELDMTNGGIAPTFNEDHIANYFKAVGVRINSKPYKFNQPLRFAYKKQTTDLGTPNFIQSPSSIANKANYKTIVNYTIHFAQNILDENDITALLQTGDLTNLELIIATGDKNDIASANAPTINSAKVKIEIRDFTGAGKSGGNINFPKEERMIDIVEIVEEIKLESSKIDFRQPQIIDMISGRNILEHAMLVLDNGAASNKLVTDVRTYNTTPRTSDLLRTFDSLNRKTKTEYGLEDSIKGFFKIDWQEKLGRAGFVTGLKSKEQIQLLTSALDITKDKILLYTKYV